jgi:hypothetical protein
VKLFNAVHTRIQPRLYPIPFLIQEAPPDEQEEGTDFGPLSETLLICIYAFMDLLNVGTSSRWWTTVTNHCKNHTLPSHKMNGRVSNNKRRNWYDQFESDLIDHFEDLVCKEESAGPVATRFVRELTVELLEERDSTNEEAEEEYLSPHCLVKEAMLLQVLFITGCKSGKQQQRQPVDDKKNHFAAAATTGDGGSCGYQY